MTQGGVAKMPQNKNEQQLIGEALYKTMKEAQKASIEFAKAFKQENIMKTKDAIQLVVEVYQDWESLYGGSIEKDIKPESELGKLIVLLKKGEEAIKEIECQQKVEKVFRNVKEISIKEAQDFMEYCHTLNCGNDPQMEFGNRFLEVKVFLEQLEKLTEKKELNIERD
jgi:hypothetical protein